MKRAKPFRVTNVVWVSVRLFVRVSVEKLVTSVTGDFLFIFGKGSVEKYFW